MAMHRSVFLLASVWLPFSSAAPSAEMLKVLNMHNVYRCMHGVPLFTWDDAIATNAQAWASNGVYEHSTNSARVIGGVQAGENLAIGTAMPDGAEAVRLWYGEIEYTNPFGTATSSADSKPAGNAIGHYTQVVWKSSTKLGCGKGTAPFSPGSATTGIFWVCQYGPAGNYQGQYAAQVVAPIKAATACGGVASDAPTAGAGGSPSPSPSPSPTTTPMPPRPSSCTPSPLLPAGGLCVYGYQCESKFCCPRMKVCMVTASTPVSSSQIKVKDGLGKTITDIIFGGGSCRDPYTAGSKCMCTGDGQPLSTWDQSACGCVDEYVTRYNANTWVTLNDIAGLTCASPSSGSSPLATASASVLAKLHITTTVVAVLALPLRQWW